MADASSYIDLHTHSTISDGSFSPSGLVKLAQEKQLKAVALTDHDTMEGLPEALEAAAQCEGLELIPGVEISVEYEAGSLHMLGYFLDHTDVALNQKLAFLQRAREERNPKIIKKLQDLGLEITEQEVRQIAGEGIVGRPHIAEALLQRGCVRNIQEAFDLYLRKEGKAYVDKERFSAQEAIAMIHAAGGAAVMAHPKYAAQGKMNEIEKVVRALVDFGLDGIEVYYSTHTNKETKQFQKWAEKYNLVSTGGSDFHGAVKPDIELGAGMGNLKIPYEIVERLKERVKK